MLKVNKSSSGSEITYHLVGTNGEVCKELADLINWYVNGGYAGRLEKFWFNSQSGNYEAVFTRYNNCD